MVIPRTLLAIGLSLLTLGACQSAPPAEHQTPRNTVAPYDTSRGEVLWAVAPLRNESGVSLFEPSELTDKLIAAAEEIRGVRTVPQNRTLQAITALNMKGIASAADAKRLAEALGADAILVGTITAYDPYTPKLGLTVGLFARPGAMMPEAAGGLDARRLATATTDSAAAPSGRSPNAPLAMVSTHLDGKNHQVQLDLKRFATGRSPANSPLGWKRYLASMDLFGEFASYQVVSELMQSEWLRVGKPEHPGPAVPAEAPEDAR